MNIISRRQWLGLAGASIAGAGFLSAGQGGSPVTRMTNPESMLAMFEQKYFHSVSMIELSDGRILMSTGGAFCYSSDKGMTWTEEFKGTESGKPLQGHIRAIVNLGHGAVGALEQATRKNGKRRDVTQLLFRRSNDAGKTWSPPSVINPTGGEAYVWQDMMMRTSSGRIILPVYLMSGQGSFHRPDWFFLGGYVNGTFVSTDAHFTDPHFGASFIFYSDDDGKTWERSRDGEILINVTPGGQMEPTYEPCVTEVTPGTLLMMLRTRVGRLYQSWSYDNGETWTPSQPTQLASTEAPAQIRTFKNTGHLLIVFTQESSEEVRKGFVRTRLSTAISRNGGGIWEHFQNVESLDDITHVEPGPIEIVRPEGAYAVVPGRPALQNDPRYVVPLPVGYGRWSYPSVLALNDRVLISYPYSWTDSTGKTQGERGASRLKVLPIDWFYGGQAPGENSILKKMEKEAPKP